LFVSWEQEESNFGDPSEPRYNVFC
jgi:hypothetical protein